MSAAIVPSQFTAENITFTEPKKVKTKDGKSTNTRAYILYEDKLRYWESPWLRAPFGLRAFEGKEGDAKNYALNISARAVDPNDQEMTDMWFNQWEQVDSLFTDHVVKHSKVALGKQYTESQREVVEVLQTKVVKKGDDDENGVPYPSRLAPKVYADNDDPNKPGVVVYTDAQEPVEINSFEELENLLPKGVRVRLIIQPKLWFISGKFGISLRVLQVQFQNTGTVKLTGYAFSKSDAPAISDKHNDEEEDDVNETGGADEGETSQVEDSEEVEDELED